MVPEWVRQTRNGILTCLFCGSLVVQTLGDWKCTDPHCKKYKPPDSPVEMVETSLGWSPRAFTGATTTSGTSVSPSVSISPSPSPENPDG